MMNDEIRMTNFELVTNDETENGSPLALLLSSFGIRHSFVLRHSEFVISTP